MPKYTHMDSEVADAFCKLQNALVSWERATGRTSLLIFRESAGNVVEQGPMPSDVAIRLENGLPLDPANADLDDPFLLRRFTDSAYGPCSPESPAAGQ